MPYRKMIPYLIFLILLLISSCKTTGGFKRNELKQLESQIFYISRIDIIVHADQEPNNTLAPFYLVYQIETALQMQFSIEYEIGLNLRSFVDLIQQEELKPVKVFFTIKDEGYYRYSWINPDPPVQHFEILIPQLDNNSNFFDIIFIFRSPFLTEDSQIITYFQDYKVEGTPPYFDIKNQ